MQSPVYIMVPFVAGAGGGLHPGAPLRARSEGCARAAAGKAARLYAGAAVIEQPADDFIEPRLVQALGRIPDTVAALGPLSRSSSDRTSRGRPDVRAAAKSRGRRAQ